MIIKTIIWTIWLSSIAAIVAGIYKSEYQLSVSAGTCLLWFSHLLFFKTKPHSLFNTGTQNKSIPIYLVLGFVFLGFAIYAVYLELPRYLASKYPYNGIVIGYDAKEKVPQGYKSAQYKYPIIQFKNRNNQLITFSAYSKNFNKITKNTIMSQEKIGDPVKVLDVAGDYIVTIRTPLKEAVTFWFLTLLMTASSFFCFSLAYLVEYKS